MILAYNLAFSDSFFDSLQGLVPGKLFINSNLQTAVLHFLHWQDSFILMMPVLENSQVFVLDNGGGQLKAGFSNSPAPRLIPNCITKAKSEKRRAFIGDQLDDCRDLSGLFYMLPFQKGYLVNWDHQKTVWDYMFGSACFNIENALPKLDLIFTEPYFNFNSIKEGLSELLFEEYAFQRIFRTHPADLSCYLNKSTFPEEQCCLVVDSGYSFTHIVPFVEGKRVKKAVKRIDIGGKLLTNHLKEIISYRQIHVLDETYVMNACKEDSCYVSLQYDKDMQVSKAESLIHPRKQANYTFDISKDYILPDFTTIRRGFLRPVNDKPTDGNEVIEQSIRLNNERYSVPELLFSPSDVGIDQCGIPETIVAAIEECDAAAHPWLYRNIVLTGGNACLPNFKERIQREIRALAPDAYDVQVRLPQDPVGYAWHGGAALASDSVFPSICVTKQEYLERGPAVCHERYYL